jgi:cytidylate kinase
MPREKPIIAVDGPSGAGKSTISKEVARRLGFVYLDTGAMYRCVGLLALQRGIDPRDGAALVPSLADLRIAFEPDGQGGQRVFCNGEDVTAAIRRHEVSQAASQSSALPAVRAKLVAMQREMGAAGGVVMEGRDIGTNVFPDAEIKIFLTATAEERARRRAKELAERGEPVDFAAVLADQLERDRRDASRELNPLIQAPDAILVDATNLTIEQTVDVIARLAQSQHPWEWR